MSFYIFPKMSQIRHKDVLITSQSDVFLKKKITKHITVVIFFTILFHQMCCMKYWKVNFAYSKCHTDELKTSPKDVRKLTSFKRPRDVSFQPLIQTPHRCIICNLISRNVDLKYQNVSYGILLLYVSTWSRMLRFWGYLQDVNFEHILQKVF